MSERTWSGFDRRVMRSERGPEALNYLLSRSAALLDCYELVLADLNGLLVAGTGKVERLEMLAAYAPLMATMRHRVPNPEGLGKSQIQVVSFRVNGSQLFLLVTSPFELETNLLSEIVGGIDRILSVH